MATSDNNKTEFLDNILSRGMKPAINTWTRETQTSKTVIDSILTNVQNINAYVKNLNIRSLSLSRHLPWQTSPACKWHTNKDPTTFFLNIENFALSLCDANFEPVLQNLNTLDSHNIFFHQLDLIFNKSFPIKKSKKTYKKASSALVKQPRYTQWKSKWKSSLEKISPR